MNGKVFIFLTCTQFICETKWFFFRIFVGQRCLEPTAIVNAVYKLNPNAEWLLKCDHRNAAKYNN